MLIILVFFIWWAASMYSPNGINNTAPGTATTSESSPSSSSLGVSSTSKGGPSENWLSDNPAFVGNNSKVDYPPEYNVLANYTLTLINRDRASAGLNPIAFSGVPSGQQHADSMAYYGYLSHWDLQGYKPYMRYTILGGTGLVAENAAYESCTDSKWQIVQSCNVQTIENSINDSEWQMMNNDTTCCSNGHRENILNASHNRVSIGLSYNSTTEVAYLVEDFEDSYISSSSLQLSGGVVTFQGSTAQNLTGWTGSSSGANIVVYYDRTPTNIDVSELAFSTSCAQYSELNEPTSCQYQGAYKPGTQISAILAPCPARYICGTGNFTYAQTWQQNSGSFDIVFSISGFESTYGSGVYTLYLWPAGDTTDPITSLSVFVTGG